MAARTKAAITTEAQKVVLPFHIQIQDAANPGNVVVPTSTTPLMAILIVLLQILEVLLNIREGETNP